MARQACMLLQVAIILLLTRATPGSCATLQTDSDTIRIFSGEPRLLIVHGYSTSRHWWAFLQHKIDRYMGGPDQRVVEVSRCIKGGTPIARWMDVETGERSEAWKRMLTPMIQGEQGKRPVVVLCQQSLQGVYSQEDRAAGIRSDDDDERIERGAEVVELYARRILEDGAAAVVIGMHIYKRSMEPAIGNERLALARLMARDPQGIFPGPDVWLPTYQQFPLAFDSDKAHPNYIGAEIMAHHWFAALLKREGLDVPEWSRQEMDAAIRDRPMGVTRDNVRYREKLKAWGIVENGPTANRVRGRFVSLFDGKTLDGWVQKNGTATYRVIDGTIVGQTREGSWNSFLCTERLYGDFELQFEVKVDAGLNSGVQIRSKTREQTVGKGPNRAAGRVIGPQVEIESSGEEGAQSGYVYGEATGRGWLTPKDRLVAHRHFRDGQWNRYRIVAQGPRIRTWINGTPIEDLTDEEAYAEYPKGFIGLQVHRIRPGAGPFQVRWRNLRLRTF